MSILAGRKKLPKAKNTADCVKNEMIVCVSPKTVGLRSPSRIK
jgi:hypothetical protein